MSELWIYGISNGYGVQSEFQKEEPEQSSSSDLPRPIDDINSQISGPGIRSPVESTPDPARYMPRGCSLLLLVMFGFLGLSFFLGIYFTTHKEYGYSMGDPFTLAGFVLAAGSIVCSFLFAQHYRHCECWKKNKLVRRNSDASDAMALNEISTVSRVGHASLGGGSSIRWDDR